MIYTEEWLLGGMRNIKSVARRYARGSEEADEFAAVGYYALVCAFPEFKGDSERRFYKFAQTVARNAIISAQRREHAGHRRNLHLGGLLWDVEDVRTRSTVDLAYETEIGTRVSQLMRFLSFDERVVVQCLYNKGLNVAETSRVMQCSGHGVETRRDRALRKLRRGLQGMVG